MDEVRVRMLRERHDADEDVRRVGGFGQFPHGTAADDFLLIRLCLNGSVGFSQRSTFQWRWHETSAGFAMPPQQLASDLKEFMTFLDTDPIVLAFARKNPAAWTRMKDSIVEMTWVVNLYRWKTGTAGDCRRRSGCAQRLGCRSYRATTGWLALSCGPP